MRHTGHVQWCISGKAVDMGNRCESLVMHVKLVVLNNLKLYKTKFRFKQPMTGDMPTEGAVLGDTRLLWDSFLYDLICLLRKASAEDSHVEDNSVGLE